MGISGYKGWESSHLPATALELLIPGAPEGYGKRYFHESIYLILMSKRGKMACTQKVLIHL